MANENIYLADSRQQVANDKVSGKYVELYGEAFYQIAAYDQMPPFFMTVVSHSDHWMFISSTGGLSAGRRNSESALFPYYTDDIISQSGETTGSKTIIRVLGAERTSLWEPFSIRTSSLYRCQRNLYKSFAGNRVVFEEINLDLNLAFRYSWQYSEKYGIVKKSELENIGRSECQVEMLDGIQNIMPYGVSSAVQNIRSNLVTAYKKNELDEQSGLAMYMLSSMIVDKAEPSEALKSTTVWSVGIESDAVLLSTKQLDHFRRGGEVSKEVDVKAQGGAYFINAAQNLGSGQSASWLFACEVNQDLVDVNDLIQKLRNGDQLAEELLDDINEGTKALLSLVAMSDGLQLTGDQLSTGRHYSNVLFNIMRGGIFDDQYLVEKADFVDYMATINPRLADNDFLNNLPDTCQYGELIAQARATGDADVMRVCYEYLPLTFSRRHGDPSRPWNRFSIEVKDEEGHKIRSYEGNWRDIFQNWEALGISFPEYVISMIAKFVNASTIDGYNPYRITREGIDWEIIEPDDPWSYIGYWGDHQIIYLLKLMEVASDHYTDQMQELLSESLFVYANVPYRQKSYDDIVKDPQDTIDFDDELHHTIEQRVTEHGADGKLVFGPNGDLLRVNLTEKLLVTLLAKLSNFIPEGGIWLNTQRPEWNDANNALVGNGVSMVTLYYLRRFVTFCKDLFGQQVDNEYQVSQPVADLFKGIADVLQSNRGLLSGAVSNEDRKVIVDALGRLGETYRNKAYAGFDGSMDGVKAQDMIDFFAVTLEYLDHSIVANKRSDGLYHAYNLIQFDGDEAKVDYLYEMLEGQVAVLSAGLLNLEESTAVLDALKSSAIFRPDQYSYMLYPDRELPRFQAKNNIPVDFIAQSQLAAKLLADGNSTLLKADSAGGYHFNGTFNNAASLREALDELKTEYGELVDREYDSYLQVFEEMFNHRAFTGRSGTFFGYEGLGSIYWHMVSKLLLATQENIYWHHSDDVSWELMGRLFEHYYEIRAGIGINKSPDLYGAVPTDPYSHTPAGRGAQQPGMTGQVKEDVINRWAELGVNVSKGQITFAPIFLHTEEFLASAGTFEFLDVKGAWKELGVAEGQLAFTYCQVPIVYERSDQQSITVHRADGQQSTAEGLTLSAADSQELFSRSGSIVQVTVQVPVG